LKSVVSRNGNPVSVESRMWKLMPDVAGVSSTFHCMEPTSIPRNTIMIVGEDLPISAITSSFFRVGRFTVFLVQHAGFPGNGGQSLAAFRKAAESELGGPRH
jgi:hypothetical protein